MAAVSPSSTRDVSVVDPVEIDRLGAIGNRSVRPVANAIRALGAMNLALSREFSAQTAHASFDESGVAAHAGVAVDESGAPIGHAMSDGIGGDWVGVTAAVIAAVREAEAIQFLEASPTVAAPAIPQPTVPSPTNPAAPAAATNAGAQNEPAVTEVWLNSRAAALDSVAADYNQQLAGARAIDAGGPGWTTVTTTDESGNVTGEYRQFNETVFREHFISANGTALWQLARVYGEADPAALMARHPELLSLALDSGRAINAGPALAGHAMAPPRELFQIDMLLADPDIVALIEQHGGPAVPASGDVALTQANLYGARRFEQMSRMQNALSAVRNDYAEQMRQAQADPQNGVGWIDQQVAVRTSDESGVVASSATTTVRVFSVDEFTKHYCLQDRPQARIFDTFYGQSSTSVIGADENGNSISQTSFNDGEWTSSGGQMMHSRLTALNINAVPDLHNRQAVYFDPSVGWVTPSQNIDEGTDWFEVVVKLVIVAVVTYVTAGTASEAAAAWAASSMASAGASVAVATAAGAMAGAAVTGIAGSIASGMLNGNLSLEGVLTGALTGALTAGLGQAIGSTEFVASMGRAGGQVFTGMVTQGAVAAMRGGDIGAALLGGLAGGLAGLATDAMNDSIADALSSGSISSAQASAAKIFTRLVGSALRAAGSAGDPNRNMAQYFIDGLVGDGVRTELAAQREAERDAQGIAQSDQNLAARAARVSDAGGEPAPAPESDNQSQAETNRLAQYATGERVAPLFANVTVDDYASLYDAFGGDAMGLPAPDELVSVTSDDVARDPEGTPAANDSALTDEQVSLSVGLPADALGRLKAWDQRAQQARNSEHVPDPATFTDSQRQAYEQLINSDNDPATAARMASVMAEVLDDPRLQEAINFGGGSSAPNAAHRIRPDSEVAQNAYDRALAQSNGVKGSDAAYRDAHEVGLLTNVTAGVNQLTGNIREGSASREIVETRQSLIAAILSKDVYFDQSIPELLPEGVTRLDARDLSRLGIRVEHLDQNRAGESGYFGAVYRDAVTGKYILVNRGTEFGVEGRMGSDLLTNAQQAAGLGSLQYSQAIHAARLLTRSVGVENIVVTGHSLGGGQASAQAAVIGARGYTFNSAGLHERTVAPFDIDAQAMARNTRDVTATYLSGELVSTLQDAGAPAIKFVLRAFPQTRAVGTVLTAMGVGPAAAGVRVPIDAVQDPSWSSDGQYASGQTNSAAQTLGSALHYHGQSQVVFAMRQLYLRILTRCGFGG